MGERLFANYVRARRFQFSVAFGGGGLERKWCGSRILLIREEWHLDRRGRMPSRNNCYQNKLRNK